MIDQNPLLPSRRRFVMSVLLGLLVGGGLAGCGTRSAGSGAAARSVAELSWLVDDRGAARRFGTAYLHDFPGERDVQRLADELNAALSLQPGAAWDTRDPLQLLERMDARVRDEYRRGEIVRVAGWLLSRSEARLYALATLI